MKSTSELRQDIVTGAWVLVATGRARRPNEFAKRRRHQLPQPKAGCPFEELLPEAHLAYDRAGEAFRPTPKNRKHLAAHWQLQVVPNKYSALRPSAVCPLANVVGPYRWLDGVGFHEVVITRDHNRAIAAMSPAEVTTVFRAYRDRYLALKDEECVKYISIFHNHGREAGASILHPHSQIIAIPVIPPDVGRSLRGSAEYFRRHGRCVHCVMIGFEMRERRRIVYQNRDFVVFCPYVSRQDFEVRIFPKRHSAEFESSDDGKLAAVADALRVALAKLERGLKGRSYNFFIHTAPTAGGARARHYHWHIEIVPKTDVPAGFEIGTGIDIAIVSPEAAGAFLRRIRL